MKKDKNKPMEWGDFTNKFLEIIGKFFFIPLILIGSAFVFIFPVIGLAIIFGSAFLFVGATLILVIFKPVLIKNIPSLKSKSPKSLRISSKCLGKSERSCLFSQAVSIWSILMSLMKK